MRLPSSSQLLAPLACLELVACRRRLRAASAEKPAFSPSSPANGSLRRRLPSRKRAAPKARRPPFRTESPVTASCASLDRPARNPVRGEESAAAAHPVSSSPHSRWSCFCTGQNVGLCPPVNTAYSSLEYSELCQNTSERERVPYDTRTAIQYEALTIRIADAYISNAARAFSPEAGNWDRWGIGNQLIPPSFPLRPASCGLFALRHRKSSTQSNRKTFPSSRARQQDAHY